MNLEEAVEYISAKCTEVDVFNYPSQGYSSRWCVSGYGIESEYLHLSDALIAYAKLHQELEKEERTSRELEERLTGSGDNR
jgi:hypothetical protein